MFLCPFLTEVSSRPKRTRISCHAALDKTTCAPFCKGKAHEVHQRHQVSQEIRGGEVEGSAVPRTLPGNVFRPVRSVAENPKPLLHVVVRRLAGDDDVVHVTLPQASARYPN